MFRSTEEQLLSGVLWETTQGSSENKETVVSINWDTSKLPLTTTESGDQVISSTTLDFIAKF